MVIAFNRRSLWKIPLRTSWVLSPVISYGGLGFVQD